MSGNIPVFSSKAIDHLLGDPVPLGHIYWDTNGNGLDCCPNVIKLFGLNSPKEIFDNWQRLSPQYQPNGHLSEEYYLELLSLADLSGRVVSDWQHQTILGEMVPTEITCVRHNFKGSIILIASLRDLRVSMQSPENGAYAKTSWFVSVLRSCPICFALLSGDTFVFVTPFMNNFLGVGVGDSFSSLIADPLEAEQGISPQDDVISWIPLTIRTRFGEYKEMIAHIIYFDLPEGDEQLGSAPERIIWLVDVTQNRKLERELKTAKELAEASTKAKSEFLAAMSHEIRTPMNAVTGLTHLILRTALTEQQRKYIETVQQSSQILLRLINNILDFSKIEVGRMTLEYQEFSIEPIITDISAVLNETIRQKNLEYRVELAKNLPPTMMGDPTRLHQVILNLLTNAIKFTEEGIIRLTVDVVESDVLSAMIRFSITDTGIGMTPLQIKGLFKPFTQASVSTTRRFGGTGLGLTIAKQLVELMQGDIECRSEPGKGTTFTFTARFGIPLENEIIDIDEVTEIRTDALLVGDCPENQTSMRHYIELLKAKVYQIGGQLAEFTEILYSERINDVDFVIFDYENFRQDFVPAYTAMQERNLDPMPMCIVTEHPDLDAVLDELSIKDLTLIIPKPIAASDLFNVIAKVATHKEELRQEKKLASRNKMSGDDEVEIPDHIRSARILLVEDNKINQMVAVELLKTEGFEATLADNGRIAVELLQKQEFDLVLMDINMPEMDGVEATRVIRSSERFKKLPILAMTASAMVEDRDIAMQSGMDDYIAKPIDPKVLFRALVKWL